MFPTLKSRPRPQPSRRPAAERQAESRAATRQVDAKATQGDVCASKGRKGTLRRSLSDPALAALAVPAVTRDLLDPVKARHKELEWRSLIMNRYGYATLAAMAGYQTLNASKLAFVRLGTTAAFCGNVPLAAGMVAAYFGTWMTSELVRFVGTPIREMWRQKAYEAFVARIVEINRRRVDCWALPTYRRDVQAWLGAQGQAAISDVVENISSSAGVLFGTAANAISLSALITPWLIPAFGAVGLSSALYYHATAQRRERDATAQQEAQRQLHDVTAAMPDNVMLPNPHNHQLWNNRLRDRFADLQAAHGRALWGATQDDIVLTTASAVGTLGVLVPFARQSAENAIAALEGAPNVINLLIQFSALMSSIGRWSAVGAQMRNVLHASQPGDMAAWNERVGTVLKNHARFSITHNGNPVSIDAIRANPAMLRQAGRWTLEAPNGSGKSTLLHAIANFFEHDEVCYLPPSSALMFNAALNGSSAENAVAQIMEVGGVESVQMLLLDEWDGFMDPNNTALMNACIDAWAQHRAIFEVRQRRATA